MFGHRSQQWRQWHETRIREAARGYSQPANGLVRDATIPRIELEEQLMMKRICLIALSLVVSAPAFAAQSGYDSASIGGGDYQLRAPTITPSVRVSAGLLSGAAYLLEDDAGGTVTGTQLDVYTSNSSTTNITGFMGAPPGGYIFTRGRTTFGWAGGQTAPGSVATSIDWGVLTGFGATGEAFCRSTPPFVCTFAQRTEDGSQPSPIGSTTYDIGTWNFDAAGDFEASPYYDQTNNGGIGNSLYTLRGQFFGSSLPAMPLVGFGALALGLAVVGARTAMKRD
jgi:hypothetical protein